ncbi:MAG: 3-hydroxyacyl-CoA dehydrogenase NAD-binding domain-containing protein [Gammaproteobacteria bacterium]|nr:3-hydroxyacyl-CoA dehydrogenase NAD-binding domain-containing protein [Gammaproteobacteria bacterium]
MTKHYRHWRLETGDDNIVWLYADKADESTNSLSREMLDELADIVTGLEDSTARGLVLLSAKKNGFIAGADINTISQAKTTEQAAEFIRFGQDVFNRIEKLRFPAVCLIHGFCMGGGYELALACRYRVALDDPGTKLGLPEINLGIHPGFGGVLRLPLLIGAPAAMDIMLSGRSVSARSAKKLGMVDYVAPERQLRKAAIDLINTKPPAHELKGWKTLTNHALLRPLLAAYLRKQVAKKAPKNHYPAPYALISIWEKHAGNRKRMLQAEEESLSRLVVGDTAQNLIRVFFLQTRLKSIGDKKLFAPKRVHVIGAGVMGGDIAAWCALQGLQVTLQDRQEKNIARVIKNANALYKKKLKDRVLVQAALDRLLPDMNGLGLRHADVIIEAIFEDKDAKHALFRDIEPKIRPDALLATNTSSIPLETLGEALTDPGRLVGVHFFNPVAMMQLVEIVRAKQTRQEVIDKAAAFTRHINRLPLPVKSSPGFLVNRVLMPYLVEAVVLESEGISAPVIDAAATGFGMPMGPITLADTVGLDICLSVAENLAGAIRGEIPQRLKTLVQEGHLGRKTGRGFYHYKHGNPADGKAGKSDYRPADIQDRLMLRFINEAVACLREGVVADKDLLDAGMIFATGFAPFRGGPLHYSGQQGVTELYRRLVELEEKYGDRFKPDAGWKPDKEPQPTVARDYAGNEL